MGRWFGEGYWRVAADAKTMKRISFASWVSLSTIIPNRASQKKEVEKEPFFSLPQRSLAKKDVSPENSYLDASKYIAAQCMISRYFTFGQYFQFFCNTEFISQNFIVFVYVVKVRTLLSLSVSNPLLLFQKLWICFLARIFMVGKIIFGYHVGIAYISTFWKIAIFAIFLIKKEAAI